MTTRRSMLLGLGAVLAMPAIVRAESLMKVAKLVEAHAWPFMSAPDGWELHAIDGWNAAPSQNVAGLAVFNYDGVHHSGIGGISPIQWKPIAFRGTEVIMGPEPGGRQMRSAAEALYRRMQEKYPA